MLQKAYCKRTPQKLHKPSSPRLPDINLPRREYSWKILCDQADELFLQTEYEKALLLYYRAQKERPNCSEARIGIRRCQDCINTILIQPIEKQDATRSNTRQSGYSSPHRSSTGGRTRNSTSHSKTTRYSDWAWSLTRLGQSIDDDPHAPTVDMRRDARHVMTLHSNKTYMKSIYDQLVSSVLVKGDVEIKKILSKEMKYVKTRGYFWRHQIPVQTVPKLFKVKDKEMEETETEKPLTSEEAAELAAQQLMKVLEAYRKEEFQEAIDLGKESITILDHISALDVEYKDEVLGNVYSVIGNSYFELDDVEPSIMWHQKDLKFARKRFLDQAESRALGNLGRSYAKAGNFEKAIEVWTEKVPLCADEQEKAWLYHELGYCYLTMNNFAMANQCGIMSFEAAQPIEDYEWQINSCVLIAQAEVAQGFLRSALETYNQALYLCDICGNFDMKSSVVLAMNEISSILDERGEEGVTTENEADQARQPSRDSRRSQLSRQFSQNSERSNAVSEKSFTQQPSDIKPAETMPVQSRHSEPVVEQTHVIKTRRKPNLKSSSHVTFADTQRQDKEESEFKSNSQTFFDNSTQLVLPSLPERPVDEQPSRNASQVSAANETVSEGLAPTSEPLKLPPIVPLVEKELEKEETSSQQSVLDTNGLQGDTADQETADRQSDNLFDTSEESFEKGRRSALSLRSSGFYINTSNTGQVSRTQSRLDSRGTMESTDPRNALTCSYDVINGDVNTRESLSRQSRKSNFETRDTLSRQSRRSHLL